MAFLLAVLGVGVLHFFVSFSVGFAAGVSSDRSLRILTTILTFPLNLLPPKLELPGLLNWLPWVAVSLTWGYGICSLARLLTR